MCWIKNTFLIILINISIYAQGLKITGAYNYGPPDKNGRTVAIIVKGSTEWIVDPDDIRFYDADKNKDTGRGVDDFSFISPDKKEYWMNLPGNADNKNVNAVFIVWLPGSVKRVKLSFDGTDISDSAEIQGTFSSLPPVNKRIRHK